MGNLTISATCPSCGAELNVEAVAPDTVTPNLRCKMQPSSTTLIYEVTSKDIATFVTEKAKQYARDVRVEVLPKFCCAKRKSEDDPVRSYANFRIAFSEKEVTRGNDNLGWFGKIGESSESVSIIPTMMENIIEKYSYKLSDIKHWLDSYPIMEKLEDRYGMTEAYIKDLEGFVRPRRIPTTTKENWIIFAAAPENIIHDMFTDPATQKEPGRLTISNPIEIQKGGEIKYYVAVHLGENNYKDNPHVREIMLGEKESKKK